MPGCEHYQHCSAGCGAVAIAQLIRYWQYPNVMPFNCESYNWNDMPNKLNYKNNTYYIQQRNAISNLLYDCGIYSNIRYCGGLESCETNESGIYNFDIRNIFKLFGYVNASILFKTNFSEFDWQNILLTNLDVNQPFCYMGQRNALSNAGHAFICDGYKKKIFSDKYLYHFNFGWNGDDDGWFSLDSIAPPTHNFSYQQAAVFNIYPTSCYQNIIMECDKTFQNGDSKTYAVVDNFTNNNHSYSINNGASVTIYAGEEIVLTDGFYAAEGSDFYASIAPCNSDPNYSNNTNISADSAFIDTTSTTKSPQTTTPETSQLNIFPNPTNGTLNVELRGGIITSVTICDLQGRTVLAKNNIAQSSVSLNIENLNAGVYLLRAVDGNSVLHYAKVVRK